MSYLEQLKLENTHPEALPKLPEPPFDSFDSGGGRHFSEKKAPVAVDLATPTGPQPLRITSMENPTPAEIDVADAILTHLAEQPGPVAEAEVLATVAGDTTFNRNILNRLVLDGIVELAAPGFYAIPSYPPKTANLPEGCPLLGGPVPSGCRFDSRLFKRLFNEGVLPLPGGRCPLRNVCKIDKGGQKNG